MDDRQQRMNASRWLALVALAAGATVVAMGLGELTVRAAGHRPWTSRSLPNEPQMHLPDDSLGWRPRAGTYVYEGYAPGADSVTVTFLASGRRSVGSEPDQGPVIGVIGGSWTMGWEISDHETYSAHLQNRFPNLRFHNFGVAGYGTLQSVMVLEDQLERGNIAGALYGFLDVHEPRNVATAAWLRALALGRQRASVSVPFVSVVRDSLWYHAPDRLVHWPLRTRSALVNLVQTRMDAVRLRARSHQTRIATEKLLFRLSRTCGKYHIPCAVALLDGSDDFAAHYESVLSDSAITFVNCALSLDRSERVQGPGVGHPNGRANQRLADCIATGLLNDPAFAELIEARNIAEGGHRQ